MQTLQDIQEKIELARDEQYKVCIWGAGFLGKGLGYDIVKKLNISVDYYCDNNEKLWGTEIRDGIICVDYHQLLSDKERIIYIVAVGSLGVNSVINQLTELKIDKYVTLSDMLSIPGMKQTFLPFMDRKTVAYTCIVGDYDNLLEPGENVREQYDYYLISDKKPKEGSVYRWINIKDVAPNSISDFTRMNRYCKINAHKIFPQYRRSIYYDGNIVLEQNLDEYFAKLKMTHIGVASRNIWDCIFEEAIRLMPQMRDDPGRIYAQMEKYWNEGMPEKFGACWNNVLIREHNHPVCAKLMEDWWHEIETQSKRDQLSFSYILWKNQYSMEDVLMISECSYGAPQWKFIKEHKVGRLANVSDTK